MTPAPDVAERTRKALHIAMVGFALTLRYLTWWQAAMLAGGALVFNWLVLPRLGGARLYRQADHLRGYSVGIICYPLAILLLVLFFPDRLDIVAACWGILAVGDGMATLAGTLIGGPPIPWNRHKTVVGSAALMLFGGVAGALLAWWCRPAVVPPAYAWFSIGAPLAAAVVAALVETMPIRLDDNLTVAASAAAVLWVASLMSQDLIATAWTQALGTLPAALAANALVAIGGFRARTVSLSGAIVGAAIGATIFVTTGWQGWLLLIVTFAAVSAASRVGLRRKTLLGIAEERGGRRGAENAIANTGVAMVAGIMAVTTYASGAAMIGFVAALTAGGSDTIASEIGKAFGRRTYLVHTFAAAPPGVSGGMSLEGTAAGLAGAFALGATGVALGLVAAAALAAVVVGATAGALAESVLGATLEHRGFVNNDLLNFLNTAVAAGVAILIAGAV